MPFIWHKFLKSIRRALMALGLALRTENNFRLQMVLAGVVIAVAWWVRVTRLELAVILITVSLVLALELVNSAMERLVDLAQPRVHQYAAEVKNLMAGAVLVTAVAALAACAVVLVPYLARY
jgi:diacylglycerol kinase